MCESSQAKTWVKMPQPKHICSKPTNTEDNNPSPVLQIKTLEAYLPKHTSLEMPKTTTTIFPLKRRVTTATPSGSTKNLDKLEGEPSPSPTPPRDDKRAEVPTENVKAEEPAENELENYKKVEEELVAAQELFEKEERLAKQRLKKKEYEEKEENKFLAEVCKLEEKERRLTASAKKTKEARDKAKKDEAEWLEVALLLETSTLLQNQSPPTVAKQHTGEEPCEGREEENLSTCHGGGGCQARHHHQHHHRVKHQGRGGCQARQQPQPHHHGRGTSNRK